MTDPNNPNGKFMIRSMPSGNRFEGFEEDNLFQGYGIYQWADGTIYKGQFYQGDMEGVGEKYFPSGNRYVGSFKNDVF